MRRKAYQALSAAAIVAALMTVAPAAGNGAPAPDSPGQEGQARLTILYDNTTARDGVEADWGFACLIEGLDKTVLFDTGTKPEILLANAKALGVDFGRVDAIVISHPHGDHMGGLLTVLGRHPAVELYVPAAFANAPEATAERPGPPPARQVRTPGDDDRRGGEARRDRPGDSRDAPVRRLEPDSRDRPASRD